MNANQKAALANSYEQIVNALSEARGVMDYILQSGADVAPSTRPVLKRSRKKVQGMQEHFQRCFVAIDAELDAMEDTR